MQIETLKGLKVMIPETYSYTLKNAYNKHRHRHTPTQIWNILKETETETERQRQRNRRGNELIIGKTAQGRFYSCNLSKA